jgi:hypothetical protein
MTNTRELSGPAGDDVAFRIELKSIVVEVILSVALIIVANGMSSSIWELVYGQTLGKLIIKDVDRLSANAIQFLCDPTRRDERIDDSDKIRGVIKGTLKFFPTLLTEGLCMERIKRIFPNPEVNFTAFARGVGLT